MVRWLGTGANEMVETLFQELGLESPDQLTAKSRLITLVFGEICWRGLTQSAAGNILGLDQPNISALMNEKSAGSVLKS
jgi:predicted XRE-type DNA-binding protein